MKTWGAREWVAFLLAASILILMIGTVVFRILNPQTHSIEGGEIIADTAKVIIGGLIGYIAGRNGNEKNTPSSS